MVNETYDNYLIRTIDQGKHLKNILNIPILDSKRSEFDYTMMFFLTL